jgi:hypothetical protein
MNNKIQTDTKWHTKALEAWIDINIDWKAEQWLKGSVRWGPELTVSWASYPDFASFTS